MNKVFKGLMALVFSFVVFSLTTRNVNADFSFAVAGDHGSDANFTAVMKKLGDLSRPTLANPINFFIGAGDLSYGSIAESNWCQAVKNNINLGAGKLASDSFGQNYPFQVVSGNHDDDYSGGLIDTFTGSNCLPNRMTNAVMSTIYSGSSGTGNYGKEYYFDYPSTNPLARFIQISPNLTFTNGGTYSYTSGNNRYNWVRDRIDSARNAGIPWVIVTMHQNCITTGVKTCSIGKDIFDLLLSKDSSGRQRADLIIQAHDHNYQRSKFLALRTGCTSISVGSVNQSCIVATGNSFRKGDGAVLLIAGTGGKGLYTINSGDSENGYFQAWMGSTSGSNSSPAGGNGTHGLVRVNLSSSQLSSQFVSAAGPGYSDSFTISGTGVTVTPTRTLTNTPTPTSTSKPGDANSDGRVDGLDYVVWLNNYGRTATGGPGIGDFNRDGRVDGLDYVVWLTNYGF